jgi:hypothetical protein
MNLIEMPPYQYYLYIFHVVDHLSKYGYVHASLKARALLEVGKALITIIAHSTNRSISNALLTSDQVTSNYLTI